MEHVGIDLGASHSHVVILSAEGKELRRERVETAELPRWMALRKPSRIFIEACTQSPAIARAGRAAEHEVVIVSGTVVRALGVGARAIKTDDRDAEVLARASHRNLELESVHVRSELSSSRRELLASRASLLAARKNLALSVKSWLRGRLTTVKSRANRKSFACTVREVAQSHEDGLPMAIELLLETFEHLCDQVEKLDNELAELTSQDEECQRLMSIPGVGPIVALSFVTHLDTPERFANADRLASYLALVPGEATTGGNIKRTSTIKAGPRYLKALLIQAAWSMWRLRPNDPMVLWAQSIADKKGKRIAIVALARKLATVMWAMWRDGAHYNPARASSVRATGSSPEQATREVSRGSSIMPASTPAHADTARGAAI